MQFSGNNCTFFADLSTCLTRTFGRTSASLTMPRPVASPSTRTGGPPTLTTLRETWPTPGLDTKKENSFRDNIFCIISFPPDFLDYVFLGRCLRPVPACSAPEGEFSDLNIWSKPLNREEMEGWTSCRLGKNIFFNIIYLRLLLHSQRSQFKGDLVNWEEAEFQVIQDYFCIFFQV